MTRTVSARISTNLHEELRERRNRLGCTINEFVAASITLAMYDSVKFTFEPEEEVETVKEPVKQVESSKEPKQIVKGTVRLVV